MLVTPSVQRIQRLGGRTEITETCSGKKKNGTNIDTNILYFKLHLINVESQTI